MTLRCAIHWLACLVLVVATCGPVTGAAPDLPDSAAATGLLPDRLELNFDHLTIDEGLPENSVRAMVQDRIGFVWIGTQNGLVRFDGREMVVFTPDPGDSTSFGGRTVDALWEDGDGDIWIGTFLAGLWRYDGREGGFSRLRLPRDDGAAEPLHVYDIRGGSDGTLWVATEGGLASLAPGTRQLRWYPEAGATDDSGGEVALNAVLPDGPGRVWCATDGRGLVQLDPLTGAATWFRHDPQQPGSLSADIVYDLHRDPEGRLWAATTSGLDLWQEEQGSFRAHVPRPDDGQSELNVFISLASDAGGVLWAGSAGGLYAFTPADGRFTLHAHDPERPRSPVKGPILSVMVDRSGLVWAGSWHTGLNKVDPAAGRFSLRRFAMPEAGLASASVEAIVEDSRGRLWVALGEQPRSSGRGRLFVRESAGEEFRPVVARSTVGRDFNSGSSVHETAGGAIYVGSQRGLWRYEDGMIRPIDELVPGLPEVLVRGAVKAIASDREGNLWVATWSGLVRWHVAGGEVEVYRYDADNERSLSWNDPVTLFVDRAGRLWIGSDTRGLNLYQPQTDDFQRFFAPERGLETVSGICEGDDEVLWLASYAGLVRFEPAGGETRVFGRSEGLPNDQVASLVAADDGMLWLSSGYSLTRFDPRTFAVRSYDSRDGLSGREVRYASARDRDGRLYFGGASGLVSFDPARFQRSTFVPAVVVTNVAVDDVPIRVGPQAPLTELPYLARRVVLPHDRNDVSFGFASLDFGRSDQNRFLYRLDGADDSWRDPGSAQRVSYSNLQPGLYTFRVRGSNRDGLWNEQEAVLELRILPPWWLTGWAWGAYVVLAGLLLWLVLRQATNRERMRASLELQRTEAAKLHELDEFKTRFLTNITHEFRTPLTLIKVPLQRLREEGAPDPDPRLETMARNARRLERLIEQLLDLTRLEAGRLPLRWQLGNCQATLGAVAAGFEPVAGQRGVELNVAMSGDPGLAWFDGDLLEKLLGNLLSNAFKHTPDGGRIDVILALGPVGAAAPPGTDPGLGGPSLPARILALAVTNSGSFVPEEERSRLFDRFYQSTRSPGSGVGLALVKELTQLLGGQIDVSSDPERGTRFALELPMFLDHPEGEAGRDAAEAGPGHVGGETTEPIAGEPDDGVEPGPARILVVEDSADLRSFLAADLQPEFAVYEAASGKEGLAVALAEIPDLVISDVMMPGMDGFELCRRLKEDERTSHVPVILLTALAETENRHAGLRLGADDYLGKPFDAADLRLRVRNLVAQRRRLAEAYERRLAVLAPEAMPVTSADERFIVRLRQSIDANLDDTDFRINELCRAVGMSRSQLHRKLTAVTGKSTSEFVRTHRLQRAAQLFDGGYGNVTEVAYAVGFRNLSYFARCFKELYGRHPSEYLRARTAD